MRENATFAEWLPFGAFLIAQSPGRFTLHRLVHHERSLETTLNTIVNRVSRPAASNSVLSPEVHRCIRATNRWCSVSVGSMTGWSRAPAAFRGSFAVPRGAIYYRGSARRCPESHPVPSAPSLRNLYAKQVVYMAERRLDLIRWWFFNEPRQHAGYDGR